MAGLNDIIKENILVLMNNTAQVCYCSIGGEDEVNAFKVLDDQICKKGLNTYIYKEQIFLVMKVQLRNMDGSYFWSIWIEKLKMSHF